MGHRAVGISSRFLAFISLTIVAGLLAGSGTVWAQAGGRPGVLLGQVRDTANVPISGATIAVVGTSLSAVSRNDGAYRLVNVPAGSRTVVVRRIGFAPDSVLVVITADATVSRDFTLRVEALQVSGMVVRASPRMAETKAAALAVEQNSPNIVSALSGDEIRSLPNFNAAEASGRIPGVSLERDEGEGKFVQVRGTEPRLNNVTIDGVHIPGTEANRIPKLDDVPSDMLAEIQVAKTLTADMDADAIGGSIKLVTKTPEGAPRGYVAGQYGQIGLASRNTFQGGATYGGRFGRDQKLGWLVGGSADRNNRGINDVEPAWTDSAGHTAPNDWSQRDYRYGRQRYGVGGDLDYRFNANNEVYAKGLWSRFNNYGTDYIYEVSGSPVLTGPGAGTIPGASLARTINDRTPQEELWALTTGGRHSFGIWTVDYALNVAGTSQQSRHYRFSSFNYTGPSITLGYSAPAGSTYPKYQYQSAADSLAAFNPANYTLANFYQGDRTTTGHETGGEANALLHYALSTNASELKVGVRFRDERKDFTSQTGFFIDTAAAAPGLPQFLSAFSDPGFYSSLSSGYAIGPVPDPTSVVAYENSNTGSFLDLTAPSDDSLGSFNGEEKITAGYVMNTTDLGQMRVNLGLRLEATRSSYLGHVLSTPTDTAGNQTGPAVLQRVQGTKDYSDLFPSVQLRYAIDRATDLRLAVTRAIARPNYPDLAPNQSGNTCANCANQPSLSGFTTGNPDLKPQYAWNYDLLFAHYLSSVGVVSGGVFYKDLRDVILTRRITYTGPGPFNGYVGYAPDNGGGGWLWGFEAVWTQRFIFLPGWLAGLGVDANYTHTNSRVLVDPQAGRQAQLLRQSPNIANLYLTFDQWPFSSRLGWTYNGAMIAFYGDGTASPTGDTYFYRHGQIDGSIVFNATSQIQIQAQVLNINNATFGFFIGKPGHEFNIQREYYRQTFFLGTKIGF